MISDVRIRPATSADVHVILSFLVKKSRFDRSTGAFTGELGTTPDKIEATLFGEPAFARVLLAEVDGQPRGFALFYFRFSSFAGQPSLWLDDLYVDEAVRSCGVGGALLARVVEIAEAHRCTHAAWTASVKNPRGIAFYERAGALIVERTAAQVTFRRAI